MRRRGLTLIEVVAATVLLSLLAAASLPLLRRAREAVAADESVATRFGELARFADNALADPGGSGLREALDNPAAAPIELTGFGHGSVTVARLEPVDALLEHAWVAFRTGEFEVHRWIPRPKPKPERPKR
jgi:prepilin-type N-terminal cleavage/methylation domain-containing protein